MIGLKKSLFAALLATTLTHWAHGQTPTSDIDRAQWMREQGGGAVVDTGGAAGVENGQAVSTPNDADMGVQQIVKRGENKYQPFTASVGSPLYGTSNAELIDHGTHSDVIIAPVVALYYEPKLGENLYAFADARFQEFYYAHYSNFDFGSLDLEAGLIYTVPTLHNLILRGEYDYNRLNESDRLDDNLFQNHAIILNAELPFQISREARLAMGGDLNFSVAADHQAPRRHDYDAYLGYGFFLTRQFVISASGRVIVRDYVEGSRLDVSEVLSLSATYRVTSWADISAIVTFANNDSNKDNLSYDVVNGGGAVAFAVKF